LPSVSSTNDSLTLLTSAPFLTKSVHVAGWHATPDFGLTRDDDALPLRELLATVAERIPVRVLLWAGAPLPVFSPRRKLVRSVHDQLADGTQIRCALDAHERPMHCHHEKIVIVDGEIAFVGGIDLTSLGGDRFDDARHTVRGGLGWQRVTTVVQAAGLAGYGFRGWGTSYPCTLVGGSSSCRCSLP